MVVFQVKNVFQLKKTFFKKMKKINKKIVKISKIKKILISLSLML